jgi:soluble lytic murein transglycosylase-like protein
MTAQQIYDVARGAGFPPATARKMVAVALKESSGNPRAYNGRGADDSYGLWQINLRGSLRSRLDEFGLVSPDDLYNPATNARVAYALWASNDANLERHWAIYSGPGAVAYAAYLAALPAFDDSPSGATDGGGAGDVPADWLKLVPGGDDWRAQLGYGLAAFALVVWLLD